MSETIYLRQKKADTQMTIPDPAAQRMRDHGTIVEHKFGKAVIKLNSPADAGGNR